MLSPRRAWARCACCASILAVAAWLTGCSSLAEQESPSAAAAEPSIAQQAALKHAEAAEKLASEGQYPAAVEEYTAALDAMRNQAQVVQNYPVDPDLLLQRGVAYMKMGFPDTAAADFSEVLRMRPDDGAAYTKRGEAFTKLGDLYKAVRDCTEAIRFEPDNAEAYRFRGEAYLARTQFDRSVADLEQAVTLDPTLEGDVRSHLAVAYRGWGDQLAVAGDEDAAAEKLARARALDPALALAGDDPDGTEGDGTVEQTVAKEIIDDAREHYERGLALWETGDREEALAAYTAAIAARPSFAEAYLRRGQALMAMGFPDTAVKDFEQALNLGGDTVEAYRLEGEAYLALGSPYRTVMSATDALHIDPVDAASYALRGRAYVELGKWDRGLADLSEAIRLEPGLSDDLQPVLERAYQQRDAAQASDAAARPSPS